MKKLTIEILQEAAKSKGGKLLSTEYKNSKKKLVWQCSTGHVWEATWSSIAQSSWCPKCVGLQKLDISILQKYAEMKEGKLISTQYINTATKYEWQCKDGHIWFARGNSIQQNKWCPFCSKTCKPCISMLKTFAKTKSGKLLSSVYTTCGDLLRWECKDKHVWLARWNDIRRGKWCPECARFKTEFLCKQLLETNLNIEFKKTRFGYKDKIYEFDGYNTEHKIAFEYQGYQHYVYPNYWHKTEEAFIKAQQRDKEKEQYCIENNISLIVIPYTVKNFQSYIKLCIENLYAK